MTRLYRPTSVLWDGTTTWVLLEGDERDVDAQVAVCGLEPADGPPPLPDRGPVVGAARRGALGMTGTFVAEIGVGIVHHAEPAPPRPVDPAIVELHRRIKERFDPTGTAEPGRRPVGAVTSWLGPTSMRPFVDGPPGVRPTSWAAARRPPITGGCAAPVLLRVGMNGIFTAGDVVLRVGRVTADPASAIELADAARLAIGVRVPAAGPARRGRPTAS